MIHFEENSSIYFKRNKDYILKIKEQLKDFKLEGECNSFGYNIVARNNDYTQTNFSFIKTHFTSKGTNTHHNYCITINFHLINNRIQIHIEKSKLKRFLMSSDLKKQFDTPYFVKFQNFSEQKIAEIFNFMKKENIASVSVKRGNVEIEIFQKKENPLEILEFFQSKLI